MRATIDERQRLRSLRARAAARAGAQGDFTFSPAHPEGTEASAMGSLRVFDALPAPLAIVVVEDEPKTRREIVAALATSGWTVHEASTASAALDLLTNAAAAVHGMITDVDLPGPMTGLELVRHVQDRWPWIKVLVTSARHHPELGKVPPYKKFLRKPYDPVNVVVRMRSLTASQDATAARTTR